MNLVGIDKQLEAIRTWLEDWKTDLRPAKRMMVLVGPPGVGKTSSVYQVSSELGFEVCEYNMSNDRSKEFFEYLYARVQAKPIVPVVFLLDEADGVEDPRALVKIMSITKNPVFLTANDSSKLPEQVQRGAIILKYPQIKIHDVLKVVGSLKSYSAVSGDVRQSLLAKLGSDGYTRERHPIQKFFMGKLDTTERWILITLLDNAHRWLYGYELYRFIQTLVVTDKIKCPVLLNEFRSIGHDWEESYFYAKWKARRL